MSKLSYARNKNERLILIVSVLIIFASIYFFYGFNPLATIGVTLLTLLYIRMTQGQYLGTSLQVSNKHFYRLNQIIEEHAKNLKIKEPKLFIAQDPYPNAYTIGFKNPYSIVLSSSLVEDLTEEELEAVIVHELGHVKFNHPRITSLVNPAGKNIFILTQIFGFWRRSTELTADRVSLLTTENPRALITALIKISVGTKFLKLINEEELLQQSQKVKENIFNKSGELLLDHPYLTKRISRLLQLAKEEGLPYYQSGKMLCISCGNETTISAKFCPHCGFNFRTNKDVSLKNYNENPLPDAPRQALS